MELLGKHFEIALETPDGIKKLRELILSLAMQGKLVPQDPNDQPASELLIGIESGKKRVPKEGKVKRQALLPSITNDEIPFNLPAGWMWVRLGMIGTSNIGLTYAPKDISDTGIPVLRSNNILNGRLNLSNLVRVNARVKESVLVQEGDLLICARNGSKALVGKTAQIKGLTEKMAFGAFMTIFRSPITDFILYFINSPLFRRMIDDVNTTTINQITQHNLNNTIFPLPPLSEQKRIVAKIAQLMVLCDKLEAERNERNSKRLKVHTVAINQLLTASDKPEFNKSWNFITKNFSELYSVPENVEELKKAILQLAVMGKLVPQNSNDQPASELLKEIETEKKLLFKEGKVNNRKVLSSVKPEEIPYALPAGWQWVRLNDLLEIYNGRAYKAHELLSSGTPVLRVGNLFTSNHWYYSDLSLEESKYIDYGDLIFAWSASFGPFIWRDSKVIYHYHIWKMALHKGEQTLKLFLYNFLLGKTHEIQASGHGIAMKHMTKEKMEILWTPLPPLAEQKRIVAKIDQLMEFCNNLQQQLTDSTKKKTAILNGILQKY